MHSHIYLASQSPRRQELLNQLGVRFELLLANPDEDAEALEAVLEGEMPAVYVQRVCALKAEAALSRLRQRGLPFAPILTADTTVAVGAEILGKPENADDAKRMLRMLCGIRHQVLTAVALATEDGLHQGLSTSTVTLRTLQAEEIERYVNSGEPFGKAGAYAVQGRAAEFIAHIDGSYSGIMGLPLAETATLLRAARVSF